MSLAPLNDLPAPIVRVTGVRGIGIAEYATAEISTVLRRADKPVDRIRITVARTADPAEPMEASAHVHLGHDDIEASATAATARTAVDRLADRLRRRLAAGQRHGRAHHPSRTVAAGPAPGRAIVAHPSYSNPGCTVEDAIADMADLGYEVHLYTDANGEDCLLQHVEGGHILSGAHGRPPWRAGDPALLVRDDRAPWLTTAQATARLDLSGELFLFYVEHTDRRARLLYVRDIDGFGLVVPMDLWARGVRG
ncbi:hypothetical protein ACFPM7_06835 [Actinokineospora guangxiensis]|uniref:Sigma 54 modulation/S30EA ribosomal protein C-terminal domain-containing protein n=1 Tax=Actinokineospora guangxiensis TaxID=1490288 RepID=A0ABW0ELE9_9PSEU